MAVSTLTAMFHRLLRAEGRTRPARAVELSGWQYLAFGTVIFFAPRFTASLLHMPAFVVQGQNYFRLVGMLVSGLGILYVVSGRLNSEEFAFASMLDRPLVPLVMLVLWRRHILPGPLALAFSISDFGGFLFTLLAWRAEQRASRGHEGAAPAPASLPVRLIGGAFGFTSGVIRNARTFHPDGRTFLGTARSLAPEDPGLAWGAERLSGAVLLRIGMGLLKKGMPAWLARLVPDAPSIALRLFAARHFGEGPLERPGEVPLERRPGEDLDLLCTAGGDRLWKLILNLAAGGWWCGLDRFDYFHNHYYAEVPHRVDDTDLDVWLRLATEPIADDGASLRSAVGREDGLTAALASHAVIRLEAQRAGRGKREPFVPFLEIRFDEEIAIDQETLHFDPGEGRGFVAHGFLTELRKTAYRASARKRPASASERDARQRAGLIRRFVRFFG